MITDLVKGCQHPAGELVGLVQNRIDKIAGYILILRKAEDVLQARNLVQSEANVGCLLYTSDAADDA